ncbi:MAG: phosphatase PAP2 family protein, partial [Rhodovibrionaceae bacterium]
RATWRVLGPLIGLYGLAALALALVFGTTGQLALGTYLDRFLQAAVALLSFAVLWWTWRGLRAARESGPGRRLPAVLAAIKAGLLHKQRLTVALPLLLLLPLTMSLYSSVKRMIPQIRPFELDAFWAEADRSLHFGVHPWELLQPLLASPQLLSTLGAVYNFSWLFLICAVCLWQAWAPRSAAARTRFFTAYILIWALLGNLAAILLSSAGPAYFAEVTGSAGPYAGLLEALRAAHAESPSLAVFLQDYLWDSYLAGDPVAGGGISAMPSVHIATAFLFLLAAWNSGPWLRGFFAVYLAAMLLGSVLLAWHYALDGYLAIAATWLIWRGAGWLVQKAGLSEENGAAGQN